MRQAFASSSGALPLRLTRAKRTSGRLVSRAVHTLPRLNYAVENGLGNFMSPRALQTVAVDYQGGLLTRLNDLVKGEVACCIDLLARH